MFHSHSAGGCWKFGGTSTNIMSQRDPGAKSKVTVLHTESGTSLSKASFSGQTSSATGIHWEGWAGAQEDLVPPALAWHPGRPEAFAPAAASACTDWPRIFSGRMPGSI